MRNEKLEFYAINLLYIYIHIYLILSLLINFFNEWNKSEFCRKTLFYYVKKHYFIGFYRYREQQNIIWKYENRPLMSYGRAW